MKLPQGIGSSEWMETEVSVSAMVHRRAKPHKICLRLWAIAASAGCALFLTGIKAGHGQSSTLRVTTRLVVVHVAAHNKQGEPVEGLKRGDFTILDDGKPQQISVFSSESSQSPQKPAGPRHHGAAHA